MRAFQLDGTGGSLFDKDVLESVKNVHEGVQSFLSMRRMFERRFFFGTCFPVDGLDSGQITSFPATSLIR